MIIGRPYSAPYTFYFYVAIYCNRLQDTLFKKLLLHDLIEFLIRFLDRRGGPGYLYVPKVRNLNGLQGPR